MTKIPAADLDWKSLLSAWSQDLLTTQLAERLEPPLEREEWLGFARATEDEIEAAERRLGLKLPPSYRKFLKESNGWRDTCSFIHHVRPIGRVELFSVENEHWVECYGEQYAAMIEDWEEPEDEDNSYFDYSNSGSAANHRPAHMQSLIQISDVGDGVYLLNPEAVTPDGEWEAWFFANWVPGAQRYPSFAHLMVHEYESFCQLEKIGKPRFATPILKTPSPSVKRKPAKRMRTNKAKAESLEELIERLDSADRQERAKAVRTLVGRLRGRNKMERRPDLVPALTDLFYQNTDEDVRSISVQMLAQIAEDGSQPPALFDALSDPGPGVVLSGIFALRDFPDERAWEPLCRFIESRTDVLINKNAISTLGQIGDERAVPTLAGVLFDTGCDFDQTIESAGMALGQCGQAGFDVLEKALRHEDARVRIAAVVGIDISNNPRAGDLLDAMDSDPDEQIRKRARMRMGGYFRRLMGGE
jgi:HEAT repeat protein